MISKKKLSLLSSLLLAGAILAACGDDTENGGSKGKVHQMMDCLLIS